MDKNVYVDRLVVNDAPLLNCMKQFNLLVSATKSDEAQNARTLYQSFLRQIATYSHDISKAPLIERGIKQEEEQCVQQQDDIARQIEAVKKEIEELKSTFEEERLNRKHKEEYDMLLKMIHERTAQEESQKEIDALEKDIAVLTQHKSNADRNVDLKRKQFGLFFHAMMELQQTWETPSTSSSSASSSSSSSLSSSSSHSAPSSSSAPLSLSSASSSSSSISSAPSPISKIVVSAASSSNSSSSLSSFSSSTASSGTNSNAMVIS
eukprot:TRINITY_DN11622_c0_g1_i1.p1 TRINITY_DN11622_c0_g1~~TRINITY_DN11622_c0_g1_i1.p1  ORF type:complete len:275 (+),score=120.91 TRINITY_DN11622_c0_g1_i1:32-826(+)